MTTAQHPVPDHIPAHLREIYATTRGRGIPPHCPFKAGDRVQRHGYPGSQPGHEQTGFRGWAVGYVGATILTGITDTGEEWWQEWGALYPDGQPIDIWDHCTCCRPERRELLRAHFARQREKGEQLDLFAAAYDLFAPEEIST